MMTGRFDKVWLENAMFEIRNKSINKFQSVDDVIILKLNNKLENLEARLTVYKAISLVSIDGFLAYFLQLIQLGNFSDDGDLTQLSEQIDVVIENHVQGLLSTSWLLFESVGAFLTHFFRWFPVDLKLIDKCENGLIEALNECLVNAEWQVIDFLTLAVGFIYLKKVKEYQFYEELDSKIRLYEKFDGNIRFREQLSGNRYVRPVNFSDLPGIEKQVIEYFCNKLIVLKSKTEANNIFESAPAIDLLELAQRTHSKMMGSFDNSEAILTEENIEISAIMAQAIRNSFYKIDSELAKRGIFPATRCNLQEAAIKLGISEDKLITVCFSENFGVYVKEGGYKVNRFSHSPITRESVDYQSVKNYAYHYRGLLRLKKLSDLYPSATVETIYKGASISVPTNAEYLTVPIQGSLAEYAQGIWVSIELRNKQRISLEDLVFIESEIDDYAAQKNVVYQQFEQGEFAGVKSNNKPSMAKKQEIWGDVATKLSQIASTKQQGNTMKSVLLAITLILNAVKEIEPSFDPMNMPGSVGDFHNFCCSIPGGNQLFPNKKGTFRRYCKNNLGSKKRDELNLQRQPLCSWSNVVKPDSEFWQSLKPKITSYTVNMNAFS